MWVLIHNRCWVKYFRSSKSQTFKNCVITFFDKIDTFFPANSWKAAKFMKLSINTRTLNNILLHCLIKVFGSVFEQFRELNAVFTHIFVKILEKEGKTVTMRHPRAKIVRRSEKMRRIFCERGKLSHDFPLFFSHFHEYVGENGIWLTKLLKNEQKLWSDNTTTNTYPPRKIRTFKRPNFYKLSG